MKRTHRTLFALIASALLALALVACDTGPDYSADINALNEEVTALRAELDGLNEGWGTFQEEWGVFQEDWGVYREQIGLGE